MPSAQEKRFCLGAYKRPWTGFELVSLQLLWKSHQGQYALQEGAMARWMREGSPVTATDGTVSVKLEGTAHSDPAPPPSDDGLSR